MRRKIYETIIYTDSVHMDLDPIDLTTLIIPFIIE